MRRAHLFLMLTLAVLVGTPGVTHAQSTWGQTSNDLHQIVLGMQAWVEQRGTLPTDICDPQGRPLLSWRVALLPFVEQDNIYKQFHLDEPWDSPHNRALIPALPKTYYFPLCQACDNRAGLTTCLRPCGPGTVFDHGPRPPGPIRDPSRTVLVVEADDAHAVVWTKPQDLNYDPADPQKGLARHWRSRSRELGGCLVVCADGKVRFLSASSSADVVRSLFEADGGPVPLAQGWGDVLFREPPLALVWPLWAVALVAVVGSMPIAVRVLRGRPTSPGEFLWLGTGASLLTHFLCLMAFYRADLVPPSYGASVGDVQILIWPRVAGLVVGAVALWWYRSSPPWAVFFLVNLLVLSVCCLSGPGRPEDLLLVPELAYNQGLLVFAMLIVSFGYWGEAVPANRRGWHLVGLIVAALPFLWFLWCSACGLIEPRYAFVQIRD